MSRIFIDRPIFAWVLAIIVMLAGLGAMRALPIEQYPDIAPTQVNIRVTYPGASAQTIEDSVTQVLEQQLTGIDGLLYFASQSSSRGQALITATFEKGTDPDIAQVQVQNKIQGALSRLPQDVQNQGVRVTKSNPSALLLVAVYDKTNTRSFQDISDYLSSNIQDPLSRVPGVGDVYVFGAPHAMRIWLNPQRLAAFSLMPSDVVAAIASQNTEVAAGEVGQRFHKLLLPGVIVIGKPAFGQVVDHEQLDPVASARVGEHLKDSAGLGRPRHVEHPQGIFVLRRDVIAECARWITRPRNLPAHTGEP